MHKSIDKSSRMRVECVPMRTTIDIPDPMLRHVKAKCALEGRTMRSLTLLFFQDWLGDGPSTAALLAAEGRTPVRPRPRPLPEPAPTARGKKSASAIFP